MNKLNYSANKEGSGSIIPGHDSKKKEDSNKQHEQDDAIEEFIDPDGGEERQKNKKDLEEGDNGMGISEKTKKQPSDESDTINDD